jgi:3-hydroxyisobutyrate dehydrogenase-like beta-hydroxyacid dehydrogenase
MSTDEITSSTRLGFIGLGYLGSRIARRLIAAGFPVSVYDRSQSPPDGSRFARHSGAHDYWTGCSTADTTPDMTLKSLFESIYFI